MEIHCAERLTQPGRRLMDKDPKGYLIVALNIAGWIAVFGIVICSRLGYGTERSMSDGLVAELIFLLFSNFLWYHHTRNRPENLSRSSDDVCEPKDQNDPRN